MRLIARFAVALLVVAAIIGLGAIPTRAQADETLPALADLRSVEMDSVTTFNGVPLSVCHFQFANGNRHHEVCHELVTIQDADAGIDLVAGRVTEYVSYDDKNYTRVNDEQTWTVSERRSYDPNRTLNMLLYGDYIEPSDSVITDIGPTTVNGTAATQYQFWSTNAEVNTASGGQYVYDVFVSAQNNVLKDEVSQRGSLVFGDGELSDVYTYSNFNGAISVSPPPASSVKAARLPSHGGWHPTSLRTIRW